MENLAKALVKAQSQLRNLGKNAQGYGYGYLTLDKLIDETRGVLAENGLVILQPMKTTEDSRPVVETILLHESGESVKGEYPISAVTMKQCNDAQQMGAAISYARRYCLASMLNIAQADDDGACIGGGKPEPQQEQQEQPKASPKSNPDFDQASRLIVDKQVILDAKQKRWVESQMAQGNCAAVIRELKEL